MKLPKLGTYSVERLGIAAVQGYAAKTGQIWRETGTGDVGVDGTIEFVNADGNATGRLVAVQVKSGTSFFDHKTDRGWKLYPSEAHRNYWESFPLPVILVLHNPEEEHSYWTDARQILRDPLKSESYIEVPARNVMERTSPFDLLENAGALNQAFIPDLDGVLANLLTTRSSNGSFPLSYFDLFVHGLTSICRSIYYGMDVVGEAVEFNLAASDSEFGMGMGSEEHEFAFGFVKFLTAQNLAQVDYSDCMIDWIDREMQPHFVAPLTARGRALVKLISEEEDRLVAKGLLPAGKGPRVAQEGFFSMVRESHMGRFDRIRLFQEVSRN